MGHSWGGYGRRFWPRVPTSSPPLSPAHPLTDLLSMYGSVYWNNGQPETGHYETGQERMQVPFWDDSDSYRRNSPITWFPRMKVPLLVAFGDKDGSVDWHQGIEMYNLARLVNKPFVLLVYPGENHGLAKKPYEVDYHRRILEWFDHHLRGTTAPAWITRGVEHLDAERIRKGDSTTAAVPAIPGHRHCRRDQGGAPWPGNATSPRNRHVRRSRPTCSPKAMTSFWASSRNASARPSSGRLAVNRELVLLYWQIGRDILQRQDRARLGSQGDRPPVRRPAPRLPGHDRLLAAQPQVHAGFRRRLARRGNCARGRLHKSPGITTSPCWRSSRTEAERLWYARATVETRLEPHRPGALDRERPLPAAGQGHDQFRQEPPLARVRPGPRDAERPLQLRIPLARRGRGGTRLQKGLLDHIHQFLIELGAGFAFVGQQYRLEVGGEDFYIDLLFYHLKLRCYIVIDLKTTPFKPEYAGKMNFYLSAVDDLLRHPDDKPSIGIILCKAKNQVVAEYALRDLAKPVGVSTYITKLVESLPPALRGSLPSPQELEAELKKNTPPGHIKGM